MNQNGTHARKRWSIFGRLVAMWLVCAVMPIAVVAGLLLLVPENHARTILVGFIFVGSALAGFSIAVPVRRAENRRMSKDEKFGTYGALSGLLLTALGTIGNSALDFNAWSVASLGAFLAGSLVGTAGGLKLEADSGKRVNYGSALASID